MVDASRIPSTTPEVRYRKCCSSRSLFSCVFAMIKWKPSAEMLLSTVSIKRAKNWLEISWTTKPMIFFFPVRKLRANAFGVYPSSRIAFITSSLECSDTVRVPFSVCDTVAVDTPAARATSEIFGSFFSVLIGGFILTHPLLYWFHMRKRLRLLYR